MGMSWCSAKAQEWQKQAWLHPRPTAQPLEGVGCDALL